MTRLWLALLVVGVGLMVPFESTITRILGVAALIAFVVVGVFVIATPPFLERDD
jgi:hypothetical protein